jgi:hypothetical protein
MRLVVCVCGRHARVGESCPFCGAALAASEPVITRARRSRTARIISVAAISVACGGTANPPDGGSDATDDVSGQPLYGAAIPDAGKDVTTSDAAAKDAQGSDADAGGVALYGAPPPPDGGT